VVILALRAARRFATMLPMPQGGASGLVTGAVFNTVERQALPLAGSIPVRLRHGVRRG